MTLLSNNDLKRAKMNEAKSKYYCLDTYTNAYKNQNDFADKKTESNTTSLVETKMLLLP